MQVSNWITLITGLLSGLGIGTIGTAYIQHLLKKQDVAYQSQRQDLEKRYRVIILLMYTAFDFEINKSNLRIQRPDLQSKEDVLEDLKAEWFNMLLFASNETLTQLNGFIKTPNLENLKATALSMRNDLGRDKLGNSIAKLQF